MAKNRAAVHVTVHAKRHGAIVKIPHHQTREFVTFLWTLASGWKVKDSPDLAEAGQIGEYLDELVLVAKQLDERAPGALADAIVFDGVMTNWFRDGADDEFWGCATVPIIWM